MNSGLSYTMCVFPVESGIKQLDLIEYVVSLISVI